MAMVWNPATGKYEENGFGLAAGLSESAKDVGTMVRGGLQGVGNAIGAAVVNPLDQARMLLARGLGGDPNNLSGGNLTDQAFGLMNQGFAESGAAAGRLGTDLRNHAMGLVGAVDAPPVVAPPPAPPLVPKPVGALPLAHPQTYVGMPDTATGEPAPATGAVPPVAPPVDPLNSASANGRPLAVPAGGGYGPGNNGINFGFGVNGAPSAQQVLAQYKQQDDTERAQARLNQQNAADQAQVGSLMSAFNDPFAKTQDKKFIMQQLGLFMDKGNRTADRAQGNSLGVMDLKGKQVTAEAALANERSIATERTQAALQAANISGNYGLQTANLTGQYGLGAAQVKADATRATAKSTEGTQRNANAEASLKELQLNSILAAVEKKRLDELGVVAATRAGQPPIPRDVVDLEGVPYSAEGRKVAQLTQLEKLRLQYANKMQK